jgi:hypothetical protein
MDADKRSSKLFGSRILSIFNPHSNPHASDFKSSVHSPAHRPLSPAKLVLSLPKRHVHPHNGSHTAHGPERTPEPVTPKKSSLLHPSGPAYPSASPQSRARDGGVSPSPKPLLQPQLNANRLLAQSNTTATTPSLALDGSMSVLRPLQYELPTSMQYPYADGGTDPISRMTSPPPHRASRRPPPDMVVEDTSRLNSPQVMLDGVSPRSDAGSPLDNVRSELLDIIGSLESDLEMLSPSERNLEYEGGHDFVDDVDPLNVRSRASAPPPPARRQASGPFGSIEGPLGSSFDISSYASANSGSLTECGNYDSGSLLNGYTALASHTRGGLATTVGADAGGAPYPVESALPASPDTSVVAPLDPFGQETLGQSQTSFSLSNYSAAQHSSLALDEVRATPTASDVASASTVGSKFVRAHTPASSGTLSGLTMGVPAPSALGATAAPVVASAAAAVPHHHRKTSSISLIVSSSSYRNVNLATLKKTLNLHPGEGERSNYVLALRRGAGTAFNESQPGKWKLPTGILPIDKNANYTLSNGRYLRLAGVQGRSKKVSGVELKHGHLAPRLLAAEVDDNDTTIPGLNLRLGRAGTHQLHKTNLAQIQTDLSTVKSSGSSTTTVATAPTTPTAIGPGSLARTATGGSLLMTDNQSIVTAADSTNSRRTRSVSLGSLGSISDANVAYYQHPGYRYGDDGTEDDTEVEAVEANGHASDDESFDDRPRLVLANPDTDSE